MLSVTEVRRKAANAAPAIHIVAPHLAIMAVFMLGDIMVFALVFFLFRYHNLHDQIILYFGPRFVPIGTEVNVFGAIFFFFIFTRYVAGDYNRRTPFWNNARLTTHALIIAGLVETLIAFSSGHSRMVAVVLASWGALVILIPFGRHVMRLLMSWGGLWKLPTALLASGELGRDAYLHLRNHLALGYDFRFFIASNSGDSTPEVFGALARIEWSPDLVDHLRASGCRQVIVALDREASPEMARLVDQLTAANILCTVIPRFVQLPLYGLTVNYVFGEELLLLNYRNNLGRLPQRILKRAFDLIVSTMILILYLPIFLFVAMAIKLEDGGPILFRHQRIGRGGKRFDCYKFRTMAVNSPAILSELLMRDPDARAEWEKKFKLLNDPRITSIGCFLRRMSLDELPQLFNVLKGEMSLVGPRPIVADEIPRYGDQFFFYKRVRPGVTGLWQVSGRNDVSYRRRVALDVWYIRNWSLWYDVVIFFQTLVIVLRGRGAY